MEDQAPDVSQCPASDGGTVPRQFGDISDEIQMCGVLVTPYGPGLMQSRSHHLGQPVL